MHKTIVNLEVIKEKLKQLNHAKEKTKIIAVSKTFPSSDILPLIQHGHQHFGENKIQEALEKWPTIKKNFPNINLHMLGKVQSNKVKFLLPIFDYLHSLDNIKLAEKIAIEEKKNNKKLKIFIQVNIANESQKNGIDINDLDEFYSICIKKFSLNVIGLMCLPPNLLDAKKYFLDLNAAAKKINLHELSIGMSNDYLDAAQCGATYLRIGSKIFGERD